MAWVPSHPRVVAPLAHELTHVLLGGVGLAPDLRDRMQARTLPWVGCSLAFCRQHLSQPLTSYSLAWASCSASRASRRDRMIFCATVWYAAGAGVRCQNDVPQMYQSSEQPEPCKVLKARCLALPVRRVEPVCNQRCTHARGSISPFGSGLSCSAAVALCG